MESLLSLRNTCEDFSVEFDIQPVVDVSNISNKQEKQIIQGLASVDEQLDVIEKKLVCLNKDIGKR